MSTTSTDAPFSTPDTDAAELTPRGGYFAKQPLCFIQNEHDPEVPEDVKDPFSDAVRHRMDEGIEFEDDVEELCKERIKGYRSSKHASKKALSFESHDSVDEVRYATDNSGELVAAYLVGTRELESKRSREDATMQSMALGVRFIWNPRLPADLDDLRTGEPDFLVRYGAAPKPDGSWAYVPGDVKHHMALSGKAKPTLWDAVALEDLGLDPALDAAIPTDLGEGSPRKDDGYQLAHYTHMLDAVGHGLPHGDTKVGLLIGKELVALVVDLDRPAFLKDVDGSGRRTKVSAMEAYEHDWTERIALAKVAITNSASKPVLPLVGLHRRTECAECPFATYCDLQRRVSDDVSRVVGVSASDAEQHVRLGTRTVTDLARLDVATAMLVDAKLDVPTLMSAAAQASPDAPADAFVTDKHHPVLAEAGLHTAADLTALCPVTAQYADHKVRKLAPSIDRARVMVVGKPHRARGRQFADFPRASIELHTDIEDSNGFIYLIGVKAFGKARPGKGQERRRSEYHAFRTWETTPAAEAKVLADWWTYVSGMIAYGKINRWGVKGYCYTHHERSSLLKKAAEHAGRKGVPSVEELTEYFDSAYWVDLYEVTRADVLFPAEDIKLKTIATHVCGFVWRDEDPSGGNSMAWYAQAVDPDEDEEVRVAAQKRLLDYNDDDCQATYAIAEWFTLNGESARPGATLPGVEKLDRLFALQRRVLPTQDDDATTVDVGLAELAA